LVRLSCSCAFYIAALSWFCFVFVLCTAPHSDLRAHHRILVQEKFGKRPCWYQVKTSLALYAGKDVIGCAPTGAGKTLSFWIPLLMDQEDGRNVMTIVVTDWCYAS
jgi:hypothetical protein